MAGKPSSPKRRRRAWTRLAILLAFGAGAVVGGVGLTGMEEGFDPMLGVIGGGALVLLVVANVLATRRIAKAEEESPRLPGEKYGDRSRPEPHEVENPSLNGVPFSESKKVTQAPKGSKRTQELNQKLEKVNRELQKANVKLGLGELSEEGYKKIVARLKERRAEIEDQLNQHR